MVVVVAVVVVVVVVSKSGGGEARLSQAKAGLRQSPRLMNGREAACVCPGSWGPRLRLEAT